MFSKVSSISMVGPAVYIVNDFPVLPILGFHHNCSHTLVSWSLRIKKGLYYRLVWPQYPL